MSGGDGAAPLRSMTGFGRAEAAFPGGRLSVEVRSLNARFLDLAVRLPAPDAELEDAMRRAVRKAVSRGRVEVHVDWETAPGERRLRIDRELAVSYDKVLKELAEALGRRGRVSLDTLVQLPGLVAVEEAGDAAEVRRAALAALEAALARMVAMRQAEGRALADDMLARLGRLAGHLEEIARRAPLLPEAARLRLSGRLSALLSEDRADPARLAMEVALLAERSDVTEELVRLRTHLSRAEEWLRHGAGGEGVGRRLDFLLQEMHREFNTVAAKAGDLEIARAVVESRAEVEKLREQAQNLE